MGTGGLFLRKLRAKIADEPTGFVWVDQGRLAGSGYQASRSQLEWLVKAGIRSILTLTEDPLPSEWLAGLDVVSGHVPMKDHVAPTVESLEGGVEFISKEVEKGRPVLVHCLAGEGRTGCVLASYLIRSRGMDAGEAVAAIRRVKPEFVEEGQAKAVQEFAAKEGPRPTPP